jgi:hypothetical protein
LDQQKLVSGLIVVCVYNGSFRHPRLAFAQQRFREPYRCGIGREGPSSGDPGFRLLDATKTYAATKLVEADEVDALRRRQVAYYRDILQEVGGDLRTARDAVDIDNVRAALRWSFGRTGDARLGADLAAAVSEQATYAYTYGPPDL